MIISNLPNPIQFFNVSITKLGWVISYPDNTAYYQLLTSEFVKVMDGHCRIDNSIVEQWGKDDSIITNAIITLEPWNLPLTTQPEP